MQPKPGEKKTRALAGLPAKTSGTGTVLILPVSRIPHGFCKLHGGAPTPLGRTIEQIGRKVQQAPRSVIESFKHFFGGGR